MGRPTGRPSSSGGSVPDSLRVTNPDGIARTIPLFEIEQPGVKTSRFLLRGTVRGDGIEGQAYLEMWSVFAGGARYFSRTLAQAGPMASLGGTFGARPFLLPFTARPGMTLEKLVVNVGFPGRGTVILGPIRLAELGADENFVAESAGWLAPRGVARLGAAVGTLLGVMGALVGVLAGMARARALVVGLLWSMLGIGLASLAGGAGAVVSRQPEALVTLLVLVGAVATAVPAALLGKVKRQYEEHELRRMQALDAR